MSRFFYAKLAATNLKKNAQTYLPYILTCIGTVMMYYIMFFLAENEGLGKMAGGSQVQMILSLGSYVIAIFAAIFLFYTHSFLIKRRKKEFGLFNILGMEKKHIAKVLAFETLYVAVISLGAGLLGGILFSKLIFMVLLKILNFAVPLGFNVSGPALAAVLFLFAGIFLLTLLNTLRQIHLAKPVELLQGGQTGEKEPKTKWPLVVIGTLSLGGGYYISLTTQSPLDALTQFFFAVLLVMTGTYCLFTAGSIAVLKLLRRNKEYYYQTRHFTAVAGMMYRMKQNAAGLANICIMATAVLVMVSTTVSLYIGMEDVLRTRFPQNIMISAPVPAGQSVEGLQTSVKEVLAKHRLEGKDRLDYRYVAFVGNQEGDRLITDMSNMSNASSSVREFYLIPLEDYNRLAKKTASLGDDEILIYSSRSKYEEDALTVLNRTLTVKERLDSFFENSLNRVSISGSYYIVVKDMDAIKALEEARAEENGDDPSGYRYYLGFDLEAAEADISAVYQDIRTAVGSDYPGSSIESPVAAKESFFAVYGGLFFLGIFLGALFIMATVLIIYYKQVSEGYDDKARFAIMQKVGMSREEVRGSIRSQVLTVFFLPLVAAGIHIAFAFPIITKLLAVLNLTNVGLFAWCTVGTILVFALFYALVYGLTAKVYYRIVSWGTSV
ncbi:ABC transporter permease [Desulfosporosinus youngiae]|uniref:ABC-type transport system, involved in lipoprotein release, permease component n=1 Tax=Desulfosporosinus youngiae DSM 17734 TaxID=768710 RepID=H5Y3G5_9FIRM|nr:ABC transporter permease [Desulfosporosinus youngiae]EHQ89074.1 ABC-type transport system, involved in lipoprotein release, permease component [Desulfosporosinus youngiae DSM 17734]